MEKGKSYRIKANPGKDTNIHLDLSQNYSTFEILSVKLEEERDFKLHSSNYGIIVGRVLANGGFGVPNAKISAFIKIDEEHLEDSTIKDIYPFLNFSDYDSDGLRYNVLPNYEVDKCHQPVGSLPSKEYILDNDVVLEVFEDYYKFTTRTNNSGDYMLAGIPVGQCSIHMDLDLSDCGILSQRPRDFLYKGYSIEEFESPNQFKKSKDLDYLSQIISQNNTIDVIPFWGNESINPKIGITRCDINVTYKFEPTCVFMGSIIGDGKSSGISKKCVPSDNMGNMEEIVSGTGSIEMIRKTLTGGVEEFQVKGTEVIDKDGVWCYQIPMNLDYMTTDEYGNLVPTDNPEKGIPTRARVRFRVSMKDSMNSNDFYFRGKVLVPNNPRNEEELDYNFGTSTKDESYRDLFWDNVYTVKSYFPRFQKGRSIENTRFSGIKNCNMPGNNNPMPYNNLRIKMPFMFTVVCSLVKTYISFLSVYNKLVYKIATFTKIFMSKSEFKSNMRKNYTYAVMKGGFCPELDNWYFCPKKGDSSDIVKKGKKDEVNLLELTFQEVADFDVEDRESIDSNNSTESQNQCITRNTDFLISCMEMNLAQEYKVINFDFYNDWINGVIYFPRWMRTVRRKKTFLYGLVTFKEKVRGCMDDPNIFSRSRYYTQMCALSYGIDKSNGEGTYTKILTPKGCTKKEGRLKLQNCHKRSGSESERIFKNGGIVHEQNTMYGKNVYYMKPCDFTEKGKKANLFATDIVLLGSLKEDNIYGIPQAFKYLPTTSYQMPTNVALTNVEENGLILTDSSSGTICSGKRGDYKESTIRKSDSNDGFSEIMLYMQNNPNANKYEGDDDVIPITEASGISWNFTGYGQGKNDYNSIYYPGGHFLGLSCWNSETNIKSCVNLSRICEAGVEMSSRHEEIGGFDDNGPKRYYLVPSGLISDDEISNSDFRTMFATLNSERQLGKEIGGRVNIEFHYMPVDGFSGEMHRYTNSDEHGYNAKAYVNDSRKNDLFGNTFNDTPDYDKNESERSFRRTLENKSTGYYMFRMGGNSIKNTADRFLKKTSLGYSLPQYENSFYFYFGLKEGATAIDKLNRDFFSVCSGEYKPDPEIQLEIENKDDVIDVCSMSMNVLIKTSNATYPIDAKLYLEDNKSRNILPEMKFDGPINVNGLKFGKYIIEIEDFEGKNKKFKFNVGLDDIQYYYEGVPFRMPFDESDDNEEIVKYLIDGKREIVGGYLEMSSEITYFDESIEIDGLNSNKKYAILISNENNEFTFSIDERPVNFPKGTSLDWYDKRISWNVTNSKIEGRKNIHLWDPMSTYKVFLGISCEQNNQYSYVKLAEFSLSAKDDFDIYHGCDLLPYSKVLKDLKIDWWKKLPEMTDDYFKKEPYPMNRECWALRHFSINPNFSVESPFNPMVGAVAKGNEYPNVIISGNPEKYDEESEKNVPMVLYDKYKGIQMPIFSNTEYEQFQNFDLSNNFIGFPSGKLDISIFGKGMKTLNRKEFGYFAYSSNMISLSESLTKDIWYEIKDNSSVITASVENNRKDFFSNKEELIGQRIFIEINNNDYILPEIIDIYESIDCVYVKMIDNSGKLIDYDKGVYDKIETMTLHPLYYYPVVHQPFKTYINVMSNPIFSYEIMHGGFDPESIDYNINTSYKGLVYVYNNNKYLGDDKELCYKSNGNDMILIDSYMKDRPEETIETTSVSGEYTTIKTVDRKDSVDCYFINAGEPSNKDLEIIVREEAPKNIEEMKDIDGNKIELNEKNITVDSMFFDNIIYSYKDNRFHSFGETGNSTYFLVRKDSNVFPLENVFSTHVETVSYNDSDTNENVSTDFKEGISYILRLGTSVDFDCNIQSFSAKVENFKGVGKKNSFSFFKKIMACGDDDHSGDIIPSIEFKTESLKIDELYLMETELMKVRGLEKLWANDDHKFLYNHSYDDEFFKKVGDKDILSELKAAEKNAQAFEIGENIDNFALGEWQDINDYYIVGIFKDDSDLSAITTVYRLYL